jgi:hypothetical protein
VGTVGPDFDRQPDIVVDDQPGAGGTTDAQHLGCLGTAQWPRRDLVAVLDERRTAIEGGPDQRRQARQQQIIQGHGAQAAQRHFRRRAPRLRSCLFRQVRLHRLPHPLPATRTGDRE